MTRFTTALALALLLAPTGAASEDAVIEPIVAPRSPDAPLAPTAPEVPDAAPAPIAARGPDTALERAKLLYDQRRFGASRAALEPLASDAQTDAEVFFWYGRALFEEDALLQASAQFSRAIALDPRSAVYQFWKGRVEGEHARTLSIFRQATAARRTLAAFEKARELDPDYLDPKLGLMRYYLEAPGIVGGSADKARTMAEEIARLNPGQGHRARAWVHESAEAWPDAEREYTQALALLPDDIGILSDWGAFLLRFQRFPEAAPVYAKLVDIAPTHRTAPYFFALCAAETGTDLDRAAVLLDAYIATNPTRPPSLAHAHYQRGRLHLRVGNTPAARSAFEQALSLDDDLDAARLQLTRLD